LETEMALEVEMGIKEAAAVFLGTGEKKEKKVG
jgi:hypothetical protein